MSDLHYANECGGRLCALHAVQFLDMGAGMSGCEDTTHFSPLGNYYTGNWT